MEKPAMATGTVPRRRTLHFTSYQEILDDVHAMAARPTRHLGNWSLGQICEHLAKAFEYAVHGAPFPVAWYLRLAGPLFKRRFISQPMKPGFKLPKNAAEYLPSATDDAAGIARMERAIAAYQEASELKPHAILGRMTRAEYDQLNFRHAEMHLSFIVPD
jgi:hypothetical protein